MLHYIERSATTMTEPVRILYRPVGPKELALIFESGHREFPPANSLNPFPDDPG
jgi:hypothetical protein